MTNKPELESPGPRTRDPGPIPIVIGKPAATAEKILRAAGYTRLKWLQREPVLRSVLSHREDLVVMQVPFPQPTIQEQGGGDQPDAMSASGSPDAGLPAGGSGSLAIVTAEATEVPDIIGKTEEEARLLCEVAGLILIIEDSGGGGGDGDDLVVTEQSPEAETVTAKGTYVRAKLGPRQIL